jgi:hypothetical protein
MEMTPESAYAYVKSIRPRVLLASAQWMAVQQYYYVEVKKGGFYSCQITGNPSKLTSQPPMENRVSFDDNSVVLVTESDLVGYSSNDGDDDESGKLVRSEIWASDLRVVYRVRVAGQAALARISCLWLRYHREQQHKAVAEEDHGGRGGGSISVDIHVY